TGRTYQWTHSGTSRTKAPVTTAQMAAEISTLVRQGTPTCSGTGSARRSAGRSAAAADGPAGDGAAPAGAQRRWPQRRRRGGVRVGEGDAIGLFLSVAYFARTSTDAPPSTRTISSRLT